MQKKFSFQNILSSFSKSSFLIQLSIALLSLGASTGLATVAYQSQAEEYPTFNIIAPQDHGSICGEYIFTATTSNGSVSGVNFIVYGYNNDQPISATPDGEGTWTLTVNTASLSNGWNSIVGYATFDEIGILQRDATFYVYNTEGACGGPSVLSLVEDGSELPENFNALYHFVYFDTLANPEDVVMTVIVNNDEENPILANLSSWETRDWYALIPADRCPGGSSCTFKGRVVVAGVGTFESAEETHSVAVQTTSDCKGICFDAPVLGEACSLNDMITLIAHTENPAEGLSFLINQDGDTPDEFVATFDEGKGGGVWKTHAVTSRRGTLTIVARANFGKDSLDSDPFTCDYTYSTAAAPVSANVVHVEFTSPSYSPVSGKVSVSVSAMPQPSKVLFEIYKNGIGIPQTFEASRVNDTWSAEWDTTTHDDDFYTIVATAVNSSGSFTESKTLRVYNAALTQNPEERTPQVDERTSTTSTDKISIASSTESTTTTDMVESATGTYSILNELAHTTSIDDDHGLPAATGPSMCTPGSLIKLEDDQNADTTFDAAVYYCGRDGKRYTFPNDRVFFSWFNDFNKLEVVSAEVLYRLPLGGNVTYRPGTRMIKIQTDPRVYAISRGGILRWVTSESLARKLYGDNWNKQIDDVSDAYFVNYTVGEPITE
jgi:hypothetical protein